MAFYSTCCWVKFALYFFYRTTFQHEKTPLYFWITTLVSVTFGLLQVVQQMLLGLGTAIHILFTCYLEYCNAALVKLSLLVLRRYI